MTKPVENFREITPQVCATCFYFHNDGGGGAICLRPNGPEFDIGDMKFWYSICDKYREWEDDDRQT